MAASSILHIVGGAGQSRIAAPHGAFIISPDRAVGVCTKHHPGAFSTLACKDDLLSRQ